MHNEILTREQTELLPLIKSFSQNFGLVGGTAIALYIGHRRSVDFDLFSNKKFDNLKIRKKVVNLEKIEEVIRDEQDQYTIIIKGVGMTFFHYPYQISFKESFDNIIRLPDLLTLAAMKAQALGRRAKWKDYVDLYFVMKDYHSFEKVVKRAKQIFSSEFNEKLFRAQLSYFEDIDYTEKINYRKGFQRTDEDIKEWLKEISLS